MSTAIWVIASLAAYGIGMTLLLRVTPMLYRHNYDEEFFLGIAALDILGAMLSFGGIIVTLALFNGAVGIRILDFLLLVGMLIVAVMLARRSLRRTAPVGVFPISRISVGVFGILLLVACLYYIVQLFIM